MVKDKSYLIVSGLILFTFIISLFFKIHTGFYFDIAAWQNWAVYISKAGIGNSYNHPEINYPPFYLYVLSVYAHFTGSEMAIRENIFFLKHFTFFIEILSLLILLLILKRYKLNPYWLLLLLINPALWYNSIIWAQVDGIHTAFVLASILGILTGNLIAGSIFLVLAINMKLQTIIFLPLILFILIPASLKNQKQILPSILIALLLQLLILLPFMNELNKVWTVITASVDYYPYVSMNAFNFWYLTLQADPMQVFDSNKFLNISYKNWGLLLFFLTSAVFLLPLFIKSLIAAVRRKFLLDKQTLTLAVLSASLVAIGFFFFNTQMHERYMHPAILFSGAYAILTMNWLPHIFLSIGYALNLEKLMQTFKLGIYESIVFNEEFIASLLLAGMVIATFDLYKKYFSKKELQELFKHIKKGT